MATCVILHDFFNHIRKWQLHVWNFVNLKDSMYQDWVVSKMNLHNLVKDCELLIVDYFIEELKVGPQYTQVIPAKDDFPVPTNDIH